MSDDFIENRTFEEIEIGESARYERTLTEDDLTLFAAVSGDVNPAHLDEEYAAGTSFKRVIAHGMWGAALISAELGTELPGPGTIYVSQTLRFLRPIYVGDVVLVEVRVLEKRAEGRRVVLACRCAANGVDAIVGEAEVVAPKRKIRVPRAQLHPVIIDAHAYAPLGEDVD